MNTINVQNGFNPIINQTNKQPIINPTIVYNYNNPNILGNNPQNITYNIPLYSQTNNIQNQTNRTFKKKNLFLMTKI